MQLDGLADAGVTLAGSLRADGQSALAMLVDTAVAAVRCAADANRSAAATLSGEWRP